MAYMLSPRQHLAETNPHWMPHLMVYFDKTMLEDQETANIRAMTLSFSFFPMADGPNAVSLSAIAAEEARKLATAKTFVFTADPNQ